MLQVIQRPNSGTDGHSHMYPGHAHLLLVQEVPQPHLLTTAAVQCLGRSGWHWHPWCAHSRSGSSAWAGSSCRSPCACP